MKKKKIWIATVSIFINLFFSNCQSVDYNHTDTVEEREERLRNSYPSCIQWNTCSNANGYPAERGHQNGTGQQ